MPKHTSWRTQRENTIYQSILIPSHAREININILTNEITEPIDEIMLTILSYQGCWFGNKYHRNYIHISSSEYKIKEQVTYRPHPLKM